MNSESVKIRAFAALVPYPVIICGCYYFDNSWATVLIYHLWLLTCLLLFRRDIFGKVLKGWNCKVFLALAAVGLASGLAIVVVWPLARSEDVELASLLNRLSIGGHWRFVFVVYSIAVNPLLEETFWRGFIDGPSKWPNWADAAFAGYHVPVAMMAIDFLWCVPLFFTLMFAAYLYRQTYLHLGGLALPYLSHLIADISISTAISWIAYGAA
ncbi:hypothetical protein STSP2_01757 [Anaerohalosphaera lusitana]|uniref:CAAX amino terminal protease self-immunity n=1 Tax=Anaerohalosphaera lusitana TaxID=1936003 RepID=A0A1U9NL04_9BACT|nr:hypothetical protein [Anaerohalosphaera lusitana]AQT68589.1 hypothetical protein STSP2_01757 [Anaerohalosphaera lusitana]